MRIVAFIACALALGSFAGCGDSGEERSGLSPTVLRKRIGVQFTLQEGSETPQGKTLIETLPAGSLVSCWSEDAETVCGVAVPKFPSGGQSFARTLDYWEFQRVVFDAAGEDPDIEEVGPEEALSPSRRQG